MRILRIVIFLVALFFPSNSFSQTDIEKHEIAVKDQIRESLSLNEELQGRYDRARHDAIRAIDLIGNKLSAERREAIRRKIIFVMDDFFGKLAESKVFLESSGENLDEKKLVKVGQLHRDIEAVFDFFQNLRTGLEDGVYDERFFEGL